VHKLKIVELKEGYEDFFKKNKHLVFHTLDYKKFVEEAFGCKYRLLAVLIDDEIKTILPIVNVKSKLFGNKIISSAYIEYGGFAGNKMYVNDLIDFVDQKCCKQNDYFEIREGLEMFNNNLISSKLIRKNLYKKFVLRLEGQVWKGIQKSKRKAIKKSLRYVNVKELNFLDLNLFYELYCKNMRDFGSPPYSKKYFVSFYENIIKKKKGKIYGAYYYGKLVSALVGFCYQKRVHILIAVSDKDYLEYRPNDAVHWIFIKWAIDNGYNWFDFGRVREGSGQFEYKKKWGCELKDLPSYFLLWKAKDIPLVDPAKYDLMVQVWRRMPIWFTKLIGMKLRRELGI